MLHEICRHRLASATIRSVALRFQDQWSRSVEGMRVNESGRDDKSSRNRLDAFPQKPNTRTGDQSGCGDERHVVADPERMSLNVGACLLYTSDAADE